MIEAYLTFAGFILAFFALVKRITSFRLNASILTFKRLFVSLTALGAIALISLLASYTHNGKKILLQLFIYFYELHSAQSYREILVKLYAMLDQTNYVLIGKIVSLLWYTSLVTIILYLLYKLIKPVKINKYNAKMYFDECRLIIASGIQTEMQQLTIEIFDSIPIIFNYASENKDGETEQYAAGLIALFSDELFCKCIVNHNPSTLFIIFDTIIKNCDRNQPLGKSLVNRLLLFMFTERTSQLLREEPYHGLGRFGTFKKLIFGNLNFVQSQYRPLSGWLMFNKDSVDANTIKKYFEIVEYSLETHLSAGNNLSDMVFIALKNISELIISNIYLLNKYTGNDTQYSPPYLNIIACSSGTISLINFIRNNSEKFPPPRDPQQEDYSYFKNDHNIHGAISNGIFEIIKSLSMNQHFHESIRILLLEIYPFSDQDTFGTLPAIQARLNILLKNKIEDNLINQHYPAVTASLIYSFGLCEPEKAITPIHKTLMIELKHKFLQAYNLNTEIASDMLPEDTELNFKSKKLTRKHPIQWLRNKERQTLSLEDPV